MNPKIKNRFTNVVIISAGKYKSLRESVEKNHKRLDGANLNHANLNYASLNHASLDGASLNHASLNYASLNYASLNHASLNYAILNHANIDGVKHYLHHAFFLEVIRKQPLQTFTPTEWSYIGQILIHRLCWDSILKRYGKEIMPVFKKLTELGFGEYQERYKEILSDQ